MILDPFRPLNIFKKNPMGPAHGPMGIRLQFWDPTSRVNAAEPQRLRTKYSLSELIHRFPGFAGFPRNGPNRAGLTLGSTRARGKYDVQARSIKS